MVGKLDPARQPIVVDRLAHDAALADKRRLSRVTAVAVLHDDGTEKNKAEHRDHEEQRDLHDKVRAEQIGDERNERADDEPHRDEPEREGLDKRHDGGHDEPENHMGHWCTSLFTSMPNYTRAYLRIGVPHARLYEVLQTTDGPRARRAYGRDASRAAPFEAPSLPGKGSRIPRFL